MNWLETSNHKTKSAVLIAQSPSPIPILGEVIQPSLTYRARLEWDGQTLKGRLGGLVFGEDLLLEFGQNEALGWVSGTRVFSVHARLADTRIEIRLTGAGAARSGWLELGLGHARGFLYGPSGSDRVEISLSDTRVEGEVGTGQPRRVRLSRAGLPEWASVVAAIVTEVAGRDAERVLLESYNGLAEG